MTYMLNNQEVEITQMELVHGEAVFVNAAHYVETGADLTDAEMDELQDKYASELYEDAYSTAVDGAHAAYEGDR